jgi:hypothetical protein
MRGSPRAGVVYCGATVADSVFKSLPSTPDLRAASSTFDARCAARSAAVDAEEADASTPALITATSGAALAETGARMVTVASGLSPVAIRPPNHMTASTTATAPANRASAVPTPPPRRIPNPATTTSSGTPPNRRAANRMRPLPSENRPSRRFVEV